MRLFGLGLFVSLSTLAYALPGKWSRTTPSNDSLVVRPTPLQGEYQTISAAVSALGSGGGNIFVYPGGKPRSSLGLTRPSLWTNVLSFLKVYNEQVVLSKTGPVKIQGYTRDGRDYHLNEVTITNNISAAAVGSDDASGTVRALSPNISLYNLK